MALFWLKETFSKQLQENSDTYLKNVKAFVQSGINTNFSHSHLFEKHLSTHSVPLTRCSQNPHRPILSSWRAASPLVSFLHNVPSTSWLVLLRTLWGTLQGRCTDWVSQTVNCTATTSINESAWLSSKCISGPKISSNKKLLLRERKRHTDRDVSSTPSAVLSQGVGTLGYPSPCQDLARGVVPWPGSRYLGVPPPPIGTWPGRYLGGGRYLGVPPHQNLARPVGTLGTPSTLSPCGQTDTCENSTLPSYKVRGR